MKIVTTLLLLFATLANAEDIYVSQSGAGSQTGVNAANAHSLSWLNTSGNWGTGADKVSPGDTVHLSGTISSTLNILGSGSAGNVITILFETGAKISAPTFNSTTRAVYVGSENYITIDGGATGTIGGPTGNPALANGIIECTAAGTALANQGDSDGIRGTGAANLTVKNLLIRNLYVRVPGSLDVSGGGSGVRNWCEVAETNNFRVENCIIHDCAVGINVDYGHVQVTGWTFTRNTVYNMSWGVGGGNREAGSRVSDVIISYNWFYDWGRWSDFNGDDYLYHHNGVYIWMENSAIINNVFFYGNKIGPGWTGPNQTAGMWMGGTTNSTITNTAMYKNLIVCAEGEAPGNAMLMGTADGYYNTIIGGHEAVGSIGLYPDSPDVRGNVWKSCIAYHNSILTGTLTLNYNSVFDLVTPNYNINGNKTLAEARSAGYELNTLTADPQIDSGGVPASGSPLIGAGPNLSSLGYPELNTDINGVARPASGNWTIGAFEGAAGPTPGIQTLNVQNLRIGP